MKATYTTANGRIAFEVAGDSPKDVFAELALIQEVFDAESSCGMPGCESDDIHYRVRVSRQGHTYYELVCMNCNARFEFGQIKDMKNLFPKRREDGKPLENGGWCRYNHSAGEDEDSESQRGQRQAPPENGLPSRHQQPAGQPAAVDDGMQSALDRIDKNPSYASEAFRKLMEKLQTTGGQAGLDRYDVIADQFQRTYPNGRGATKEILKGVVRQLFGELRNFETKAR